MALTAANTFTGGTTISNGALLLSNANALQNSTVTLSNSNGLQFTSGIGTFNLGNLAGASNLSLLDAASAAVTLSVGSNNATPGAYPGIMSGSGGALTKVGTGTLQLNGANTYTGATTISNGTLKLGANNAIPIGSLLTITAGGTLNRNSFGGPVGGLNMTGGVITGGGELDWAADVIAVSSGTTAATISGGVFGLSNLLTSGVNRNITVNKARARGKRPISHHQ